MTAKIVKWRNGLGLFIPDHLARQLGLNEGDSLQVMQTDNGFLVVRPRETESLVELVNQITPENVHGETDWGRPVGREIW